jgi:hypothetical protein
VKECMFVFESMNSRMLFPVMFDKWNTHMTNDDLYLAIVAGRIDRSIKNKPKNVLNWAQPH